MSHANVSVGALLDEPQLIDQTNKPRLLSLSGRLGRLRYVVYGASISLFLGITLGAALGTSKAMPGPAGIALIVLVYAAALFVSFVLARRRLNDLDKSGWMSLLMLVPFVNIGLGLWMLFGAGTPGPNRFGPAPAPNSRAVVVAGWVFGVLWGGLLIVALSTTLLAAAISAALAS